MRENCIMMQKSLPRGLITMEIKRDFYLQKLISRKHNRLIKVITGVRRCGKSYLLNTLFHRHLLENKIREDRIIRFAFDSADDLLRIGENPIDLQKQQRKANPEKFLRYLQSRITGQGPYYLLLDEIQLMDAFETVLNGYLRKDNLDIYVTGSNARFLSSDIISEFAGRGDEVHMYPLSFSEFMSAFPGDKYEGFSEYMLYGGIPLIVLRKNPEEKAEMLKALFSEIYIRDIVQRHKVRSTGELEDLLNIVSSSVGSLTNAEKLKNTFHSVKKSKITSSTISRYLSYFEDSFLLEAATRYDIKGKAYIETPRKYYFSDTGLRNARLNFRQTEPTHLMENILYNELRMRGFSVDVGIVPLSEKEPDGKAVRKQLEVDFVCNLGSARVYIQSAYAIPDEEKRRQETRPYAMISDSFKKIIVTGDIVRPQYDENGILTVNLYDFLLDPHAMEL